MIVKTAIKGVLIGLFTLGLMLFWDYGVNAEYRSVLLEPYGKYGEGVSLSVARFGIDYDVTYFLVNWFGGERHAAGYYDGLFRIIKVNEGAEWAIPHELGHHCWRTRLNQSQRDEFCEYSDWQGWSYDGSCEEGFAEMKGMEIEVEVKK